MKPTTDRRLLCRLLLPLCLVATLARVAAAESASPTVPFQGRVTDPSPLPIPGARIAVTAVGDEEHPVATAISGRDGRFAVDLAPGDYTLRVSMEGFVDTLTPITVPADGRGTRDFVLQVPAIADAITVRAPSGYAASAIDSATKTPTALRNVPQSVTVVTRQLMQDQLMSGIGDVVRYVPGVSLHQGENNRDQVIVRGNSSSADFFVDGVRDDVQYYRDLYNLERVEALKGPNAMIFGRGGGGGVINQVTKEAGFDGFRELSLQGGSFGNRRATGDFEQALGDRVALRVNGMFEKSGSFRDHVDLARSGIAPTLTFRPDDATTITLGYEHLHDARVADRGLTSWRGRPARVPIDTYYGNPDDSRVRATAGLASARFEHRVGTFVLRNRTLSGDYDRFYQNYVPGAATADRSRVALSAYNNATRRRNLFNQTDATWSATTGVLRHTLLAGVELGRQRTASFRNTGYFGGLATSILVPFDQPTIGTRATFRQSATDADNQLRADVSAVYAQDQVELSPHVELLAGLRLDRFDLRYENRRNGDRFARVDDLVSPRLGVVVKPRESLSLYGSYSVSYLPGSGDQFASLTAVTVLLEPETFRNYELGAKWSAGSGLELTAAVYRLDRANTRSTDPNDPTRVVQTGSQRSNGVEIGANGQLTSTWSIAGGYAYQDTFVTSGTVTARAGATGAQVPRHTVSLWNNVQIRPRLGAALGVIYRSAMFATIDDTVTLPGYTRVDAAAYWTLSTGVRVQVNVENLLAARYWANADSNTNLSPGSPRAVRAGVIARF